MAGAPAPSESSSCPEGHYDIAVIGVILKTRPASESSSCPEGHYDVVPRLQGGVNQRLDPNHPPARKGITTPACPTGPARPTRYPNHPPARKGITTNWMWRSRSKTGRSSESSSCPEGHYDRVVHLGSLLGCLFDPNHPPARKGITTAWNALHTAKRISFIRIILLPGRALRPKRSAEAVGVQRVIRIILLPGRALRWRCERKSRASRR